MLLFFSPWPLYFSPSCLLTFVSVIIIIIFFWAGYHLQPECCVLNQRSVMTVFLLLQQDCVGLKKDYRLFPITILNLLLSTPTSTWLYLCDDCAWRIIHSGRPWNIAPWSYTRTMLRTAWQGFGWTGLFFSFFVCF